MFHLRLGALVAAGLAVASISSAAEAVTLDYTGNVADFSNSVVYDSGTSYSYNYLSLTGPATPTVVSPGDTVTLNIALDKSYTIAPSGIRTDLLTYLTGSGFDGSPVKTTGTVSLYSGSTLVGSYSQNAGTSNQIATYAILFPPENTSLTFDSISETFTVTTLASPVTIDGGAFNYTLVSPAPEPATWAMMIGGFGMVGGALRRRTKVSFA